MLLLTCFDSPASTPTPHLVGLSLRLTERGSPAKNLFGAEPEYVSIDVLQTQRLTRVDLKTRFTRTTR